MRYRSSAHAQCAVFQEIDGQLVQVGTDFGTSESLSLYRQVNRVIHWENDLYAINRDTIFKYDVANSGDWDHFYTFSNPAVAETAKTMKMGFTVASNEGSGVLTCGYVDVNSECLIVLIDKDLNVTESAIDLAFDTNSTSTSWTAMSWRNSLAIRKDDSNGVTEDWIYDLKENTFTLIHSDTYGANNPQLVIGDNIYYMGYGRFQDDLKLYKKSGNTRIFQANIGGQIRGAYGVAPHFHGCAAEISGVIYLFNPGGVGGDGTGWQCHEIRLDSNGDLLSQANVTSIVIPTSPFDEAASNGAEAGMSLRIDGVTNSGIDPIYEFVLHTQGQVEGSSSRLYRWNNAPSGRLEFVAHTLDDFRFSNIQTANGTGGGQIWSGSGTLNVSQPCLSLDGPVGPNVNCEFTVYGSSQSGVALELLFDKNGENTIERATILSTDVGSVVGNRVVGLTADNTTKVTVGWDTVSDGIVSGDNPKISARVFIP